METERENQLRKEIKSLARKLRKMRDWNWKLQVKNQKRLEQARQDHNDIDFYHKAYLLEKEKNQIKRIKLNEERKCTVFFINESDYYKKKYVNSLQEIVDIIQREIEIQKGFLTGRFEDDRAIKWRVIGYEELVKKICGIVDEERD